MDNAPTPTRTLRLVVEIDRTPDGRLEGRIRADQAQPWLAYSGVLELLKALEELLDNASLTPTHDPKPKDTR
jgi:hypothetical protein